MVNMEEHVKDVADQNLSDRNAYGIISKKESQENISEESNNFLLFISQKVNGIDRKDLTCVQINIEKIL